MEKEKRASERACEEDGLGIVTRVSVCWGVCLARTRRVCMSECCEGHTFHGLGVWSDTSRTCPERGLERSGTRDLGVS